MRWPMALACKTLKNVATRTTASLQRVLWQRPYTADAAETMEFPGGQIPFTEKLKFVGGVASPSERFPCYRTLDSAGRDLEDAEVPFPLNQELAYKMYRAMAELQTTDTIFYEAQRQGRFSFYMTSYGEEATTIGSAAALADNDMVFAQYREQGVLMWRGFTTRQMADQCYGNRNDPGRGRQMPIHYGSKELHYQTISSPLATQLPHAVGAAYAMKLDHADTVVATYFGEGAASEGDFHAACNFASTLGAPCVFICRNNGYAISTPASEQYKGDGIAARGPSYGIPSIRVDGGDVQAVYNATKEGRALAHRYHSPVLIECMSYRTGHHSTSDDSSRYRTREEMQQWRARDPVVRFRNWLIQRQWWDEARELTLRRELRQQAVTALEEAAKVPKPPLTDLFTDVYHDVPWHLREQQEEAFRLVAKYPELLPEGMSVR